MSETDFSSWPHAGEQPVEIIKPKIDAEIGFWSPVCRLSWNIGFFDAGSTPHLQVAVCQGEMLPDGTLRYDSGVRDFGCRLVLDCSWKYKGDDTGIEPFFIFLATVNKSLGLPTLRYEGVPEVFAQFGRENARRDFETQLQIPGKNIPDCWGTKNAVVVFHQINPIPPFPTTEFFRLRDWCE